MAKFNFQEPFPELMAEMMKLKEWLPGVKELVKKLRENYKLAYLGNYLFEYGELSQKRINLLDYLNFTYKQYS